MKLKRDIEVLILVIYSQEDIHQDITVTYGQKYLRLTLLKLLKTKDYLIKKLLINLKNTSIQKVIQMI